MKRRNNEDRLMGGHKPTPSEDTPQMPNPMDFVTPTEIVDLPSMGSYPEGHPLCGKETIEIKHMTAKDEDILTNRSMLKKGIAIDRLLQNILKDKSIDARTLYVGDRNAILIHARASAYGQDYKTKIQIAERHQSLNLTLQTTKCIMEIHGETLILKKPREEHLKLLFLCLKLLPRFDL